MSTWNLFVLLNAFFENNIPKKKKKKINIVDFYNHAPNEICSHGPCLWG